MASKSDLDTSFDEYVGTSFTPGLVEDLHISKLKPSLNLSRPITNEIEQLALSIRMTGLLQPIIVRPIQEGFFEIVAGNRRYSACKILRWKKLPCHIMELDDKSAFIVSLSENVQRRSIDPVEEAEAFKKYIEEYGWGSSKQLAQRIGKSSAYVSKRLALLDLPQDVLEKIRNREISPSTAEELLTVDDRIDQSELARLISERRLSMRKARRLIDNNKPVHSGENSVSDHASGIDLKELQRMLDKTILIFRVSLSKIGAMMEDLQANWLLEEILMQQRKVLHDQIDILIKEKRKLKELHLR